MMCNATLRCAGAALAAALAMAAWPTTGCAEPTCTEAPLTDRQVTEIIAKQRASRSDLPPAFAESRTVVKRQGCHYTYVEYGLPERPDYNRIFKLNQKGVIVDVQSGVEEVKLQCPPEVLSEAELAAIVQRERAARKDLPAPYEQSRPRVARQNCLYLYFEYAVPEARGKFQTFTIDPYGELIEAFRSQPY
jgi:hypothetical protein